MNFKLPVLALVFSSAFLLSACGAQTASVDTTQGSKLDLGTAQTQNDQAPSGSPSQNGGPRMDLTVAANKLNVTVSALQEALGVGGTGAVVSGKPSGTPQRMDLTAAANKLNVTVSALQEALGVGGSGHPQGTPPSDTSSQN